MCFLYTCTTNHRRELVKVHSYIFMSSDDKPAVKDVVIVSGGLAVSPPSPRRRPVAPSVDDDSSPKRLVEAPVMRLPSSYQVPTTPIPEDLIRNDLKIDLEKIGNVFDCDSPSYDRIVTENVTPKKNRFRKSSSTGDSYVTFQMSWRPQKGKKAASLSKEYKDFPQRMLKVYDEKENTCLYHSAIAHDAIDREWPVARFPIRGSARTNLASFELRFELWASRMKDKVQRQLKLIGNAMSNLKALVYGADGYRLTVRWVCVSSFTDSQ